MQKDEGSIISKQLSFLTDQNTRILSILENDDKIGKVGLVQRTAIIEGKVDKIDHSIKISKAVKRRENMIFGSIGAAILMALKWIVSALLPFFSKL